MGMFDSYEYDEKKEADDLRLRILNFIGKKGDKGVDKGLITPEQNKKLYTSIDKLKKKYDTDWWLKQKGQKSYDIAMDMLKEAEFGSYFEEIEILEKIEKA